jgi:DNA polymerase-3 subunit epsilon
MANRVLVIDFETANFSATSACAIGAILIEDGKIVRQFHSLIKPPSKVFQFTSIHGITWNDVKDAPDFKEVWKKDLGALYESAELLVAHNIGFDSRVLKATADHHSIQLKNIPTACTVKISRGELKITPAKLDNVCRVLDIPLKHHEALSDSLASAYIYLFAKTGKKQWKEQISKGTLTHQSASNSINPLGDHANVLSYEQLDISAEMNAGFEITETVSIKKSVPVKKLSKTISKLNSEKSKATLKAILQKKTTKKSASKFSN